MKAIRIDVFQGPQLLGSIDGFWNESQTWDFFWSLASVQYPDLQRIEIHIDA